MRTIMKIIGILPFLILSASISTIQAAKVGDFATAQNYCLNEKDMRILAKALSEEGQAGYLRVMKRRDIACVDNRMHKQFPTVTSILKERVMQARHKDGTLYQFWRTEDKYGTSGYVWVKVEEEEI